MTAKRMFPSPFEVPTPAGCEGWQEMYPYYLLFSEDRRPEEAARCWFRDGMHFPEPMAPFDSITADVPFMALGQANARVFVVPPALGISHRILNGYVYMGANGVADPQEIGRRAQLFMKRAGYYYQNWDKLYAQWVKKVEQTIHELADLKVPDLPEVEDEAVVFEARGHGSAHELLVAYNRCLESIDLIWHYHFEFLNLGYAAYLTFSQACKQAFPDMTDQTMSKMVSGVEVMLFKPDEELKRLAKLAIELKVADKFKGATTINDIEGRLSGSSDGKRWLEELKKATVPWFFFSYGNGFYHHHRSWVDNATLPIETIGHYIERLQAKENIERPLKAVRAERDHVTKEYRALLSGDALKAFDDTLGLARTVFPYVENHNFYIEHWYHTIFWNKVREFGVLMTKYGFFQKPDDIFYLHRHEVYDAIADLRQAWAAGEKPRGPRYWPPIVARRRQIWERMREWQAPPALGPAPEEVNEPLTIMLWAMKKH